MCRLHLSFSADQVVNQSSYLLFSGVRLPIRPTQLNLAESAMSLPLDQFDPNTAGGRDESNCRSTGIGNRTFLQLRA